MAGFDPITAAIMGIILFIWLTTEIILNVEFYYPLYHIPMYTISLLLVAVGTKLRTSLKAKKLI